jgi:transcriptional regulator with XRE-family HTH domain
MENKFDIGDFVNVATQQSVTAHLVDRVKNQRKQLKLSRQALSVRSGVTYSSIRRFEETGEISLSSLMKIAQALGALEDFNSLFKHKIVTNLKDLKV